MIACVVGAALALLQSVAPISAATYFGGILAPGGVYLNFSATPSSSGVVPAGAFSDTYQFHYTPPEFLLAATSTTVNNLTITPPGVPPIVVFNISDFRLQWVLEGPGGGVLYDSGIGNGVVTNLSLPLPTPNGIGPTYVFDLILSGVATGSTGGFYNYTLVTEAAIPLPGTALLLATVLLGGIGVAQRRRRASSTRHHD